MGPGNRLGNEASDLNRQVPRQRQWNSAAQTKSELTTDRTRRCRHLRELRIQRPLSHQGMAALG